MPLSQATMDEKTPKTGASSVSPGSKSSATTTTGKPLAKWMKFVLRFAAVFNICAGLFMLIGYHETYKIIGMEKPDLNFPMQLVGILVGLFGVGYYLVARNPTENRAVLMLGFWSKFLGSCLGTGYVILGKLPLHFVAVYFFADVIYLPFFYVILKRLYALARDADPRR
jgi:small multidrug resistance pump